MTGSQQWTIPFRAYSAANWLAMYAERHMHQFGTTEEQMAQIALNVRATRASIPRPSFGRRSRWRTTFRRG